MNQMLHLVMLLYAMACNATIAPPGQMWIAASVNGKVLCSPITSRGVGAPFVVGEQDAAECPLAIGIGCDGNPALAWVTEQRDILFSSYDGQRWATPELVSISGGKHRGIPSLGICGDAVVAWAESEEGMFEDIFYSVKTHGQWSAPRRAHEANNVPDIMPSVAVSVDGAFSINWKSFDGDRYIERSMGDQTIRTRKSGAPGHVLTGLINAGVPPHATLAWVDEHGYSQSSCLKGIIDIMARTDMGSVENSLSETDSANEMAVSERSTDASTTTIIAFGDSITYGRGSRLNGPRTGYPAFLQGILEYNYPGHSFQLINKGVPGEVTADGLDRISEVLDSYPADYILIMEGTNDIFSQFSFATIEKNLESMALRAEAHGVHPLLATIIPTVPNLRPQQYRSTGKFYDAGYVQRICARRHIPCADQWNAFCSIPNFGTAVMDRSTGNHPNTDGYRYVMAPVWYQAVAPLLGIPFEPQAPLITFMEDAQNLSRGGWEDFSYQLTPSNDLVQNSVDCYVGLLDPANRFSFISSKMQLTKATTPMAPRVQLNELPNSGPLLALPIGPSYLTGVYTLYLATVPCMRNPWRDSERTSFAEISFEVK
ncbi:MAG: GDSL-type esterase/lipase family protein [Candidatus Aureabacteria bacterium]|nr:GDSL-type esterase/lipase family protein [Candidatus Auribacterota bacterium]